jgi:outer membrane receptor protein involved in Fe transport
LKASTCGLSILLSAAFAAQSSSAAEETGAAAERRQIEEVVVTAERKESTVSDTSISITAFTGQMLEDFGIRNQEDLQKFIPAAVIEPYDMAIRGVGRNFRALGGDPGIATYLNGVYSEDFGIASTEGGLFDIERIEVLRGPQGTLYGRNAIGGAVNFINKQPTNEFEGEAKIVGGNYDLREEYGMLSGPIIDNILSARLTGVKRTRDGYIDDKSGNQNPDNYGDENYALALKWTPTDNLEFNTRGNERSYRRRMGGADAAGIVNLTEDGGAVDPATGNARNTSTFAWGYRRVDDTVCPTLTSGRTNFQIPTGVGGNTARLTPECRITTATAGYQNQPGSTQIYTFTDPATGQQVEAQRVTPGVDFSGVGAQNMNNKAFGTDNSRQHMLGLGSLSGPDVSTDTSGHQDEYFDQQANSTDIRWTVNDTFSIKYIFGYTDYFYDRTSDVDLTSNTDANTLYSGDEQFYVSQETEYVSHELQFFNDWNDRLTSTTGLFYYQAAITQRGDYYNSNSNGRYTQGFNYAPNTVGALAFIGGIPQVSLFTAKQQGLLERAGATPAGNCVPLASSLASSNPFTYCFGRKDGDPVGSNTNVPHGPTTAGTDTEYQSRTEREAFAIYSQSVFTINEHFALTLGARWARDQLHGEENAFYQSEGGEALLVGAVPALGFVGNLGSVPIPLTNFIPCTTVNAACVPSLAQVNQAIGAMDANGQVLNYNTLLTTGVPISQSLWRQLYRKDDAVTGRINLDWTPNDKDLIYFSITSGTRAGGFNLGNFSANAKYQPESLVAYELGYKGEIRDGTMQINSAVYYYDYSHVHTPAASPSALGGVSTSTFAVPGAEMIGFDTDVLWLLTDRMTVGATVSFTHSEYTENFNVIDEFNAQRPGSLFDPLATPFNIKGNQMLRVPERKFDGYVQYAYPMGGDRGTLTFLADYSWIDKVYFSLFEEGTDKAPAYSRVDTRLTWLSAQENWNVSAFCNNVLDDIGIRQIEALSEADNFRRTGTVTNPRTFGLEVLYKFGAYK